MPRKKSPDVKPFAVEETRDKDASADSERSAGNDPAPLASRPKRSKKASKSFSLELTKAQRESMLLEARFRPKLKKRLAEAGDGTQVVSFALEELNELHEKLGEAALFSVSPDKEQLLAVLHRVIDLVDTGDAGRVGEREANARRTAPKNGDLIYQFKITLLDIRPPIWRRIRVRDCTLADLHDDIQAVFGWWDEHMHEFEIDGERYGRAASDDEDDDFDFGCDFDPDVEDEAEVRLSKLIPRSRTKARWIYEYDFGDSWRHEILFEGFAPNDPEAKYPLCVEGKRACPPEDSGGPWRYPELLATMADPDHEGHEEMAEFWGSFDPEAFDAAKATEAMTKAE
jgi:hypothetical protein